MERNPHLIKSLKIKGMWGDRDYNIAFHDGINIIIGKNGSGKTTLLDILRHVLTVNLMALADMVFDEIVVELREFTSESTKTVQVSQSGNGIEFRIARKSFRISTTPLFDPRLKRQLGSPQAYRRTLKDYLQSQTSELQEEVSRLVPATWLPVSRRLPISEDDELEYSYRNRQRLESVDERLNDLLDELVKYRLRLDKKLSERYKIFERQVMSLILYSAEQDTVYTVRRATPPTENDKLQIKRAFKEAGLFDDQMEKRIEQHFTMAAIALARISDYRPSTKTLTTLEDFFVMPLINRTKEMVRFAGELEQDKKQYFNALDKYSRIISSFVGNKIIYVDTGGRLVISIRSKRKRSKRIQPQKLSSGEKQILILLTQALLSESDPVVYVADEPELSLHVEWQEKLIESLKELGGTIQIIVATHSPDIIGPFRDNVISLDRM